MALRVSVCGEKWDTYPQSAKEWNCGALRGKGSTVLTCELFVHIIASLFVDSKRALLLIGYGTSWVSFGGLQCLPSLGLLGSGN